jgi:hypothetical protein
MYKRLFGAWKASIVEATAVVLEKYSTRISRAEGVRIQKAAASMQARRTGRVLTQTTRPPASNASDPASPAPSQAGGREKAVQYVHQLCGLFGDGNNMSPLFESSQRKWGEVAARMGATYHMWNAGEVETLVKQHYPQFWDMYTKVRYPIMRYDIGRLCILHHYGGLYSELVILPNRDWYQAVPLAVTRVLVMPKCDDKRQKWISRFSPKERQHIFGRKLVSVKSHVVQDMEVMIGTKGNRVFLQWLAHIGEQIASKEYVKASSVWHTARMRYVENTTGTISMERFFKSAASGDTKKHLQFLECNDARDRGMFTDDKLRMFDVVSHATKSPFTDEHEIHVPVGPGDTPLLAAPPTRKRMREKTAAPQAEEAAQAVVQAHSQGEAPSLDVWMSDLREIENALREHYQENEERAIKLQRFFHSHRDSDSVRACLRMMPWELHTWCASHGKLTTK